MVDRTGIQGRHKLSLEWADDDGGVRKDGIPDVKTEASDGGPSSFSALQERLGLKLDAQKGPVEIIVIERADKPTEN